MYTRTSSSTWRRDTVPEGPGCVNPDSVDARQFTETILLLCCFAETYEMDDLANRSMDALRLHEHQCSGSLVGRHIEEVYEHSGTSSKLRHYCALRIACFVWNAGNTGKLSASLTDLLYRIPDLEGDVHAAQADLREKVRVQEPDCDSPENQFGTCEFHTHRKGDICHVSLAMIVQGRRLIITNLPIPMTEDDLMDFVARYSV